METVGHPLESFVERFTAGVQSGADRILTLTTEQVQQLGLETELMRPLLRGRDVRAYGLGIDSKQLIFPYQEAEDRFSLLSEDELRRFPKIWHYLNSHRQKLEARLWFGQDAMELSGAWYGLMYLQSPKYLHRPHLLTPALSNTANFALGDGTLFATGTAGVTGVSLKRDLDFPVEYLLGILNSDVLSLYAVSHSPIYQGGYHKFSTQYLQNIPVIRPAGHDQLSIQAQIIELVKRISDGILRKRGSGSALEQRMAQRLMMGARAEINRLVRRLYELDENDSSWISEKAQRLGLS